MSESKGRKLTIQFKTMESEKPATSVVQRSVSDGMHTEERRDNDSRSRSRSPSIVSGREEDPQASQRKSRSRSPPISSVSASCESRSDSSSRHSRSRSRSSSGSRSRSSSHSSSSSFDSSASSHSSVDRSQADDSSESFDTKLRRLEAEKIALQRQFDISIAEKDVSICHMVFLYHTTGSLTCLGLGIVGSLLRQWIDWILLPLLAY